MTGNPISRLYAGVVESMMQLWLLLRESLSLRLLLVNRFTIVLGVVLLATAGASGYMANNDGNRLTGTVVTQDGTPVGNATVDVRVVGIENVIATKEAVTDSEGRFTIEEYSGVDTSGGIDIRIRVTTEDGYQSPTSFRHAYFPDQDLDVRVVIDPDGTTA